MAAPSPPPFFAAWRVEAPLSAVSRRPLFSWFPFPVGSTFCALYDSLPDCARRNILPREDPLYECGRPCDTMSCLFFTALWLQQSQSVLMQEIQFSQGYRFDLLQDVADQGYHMLTSGAHLP